LKFAILLRKDFVQMIAKVSSGFMASGIQAILHSEMKGLNREFSVVQEKHANFHALLQQDIHHVRHEMGCKRLCSLLRNSVLRLRLFGFQN
jgi:hypothetical protein